MFLIHSLVGNLIISIVSLLALFIFYCKWKYQHWSRRGVPSFKTEIPFGSIGNTLRGKEHISVNLKKIYEEIKSKQLKYGGIYIFTRASFFPLDLDIIKNIMCKDFQYFADRNSYYNEKDPLQQHLLNLTGEKWKNLRAKLTPTFTSGKMKMMFSVMAECQNDLVKRMECEYLKGEPVDIKEILACFTTNIIGSCAFGLDCKALEDGNSEFRTMGRKMMTFSRWVFMKRIFGATFPKFAKMLNISLSRKYIADFIIKVVTDTIKYREENNYIRNDFMQLMINLKNNKPTNTGDHDGKPFSLDEVASQCIVFFAAGFETSSTLMSFALYELAKNQDIQKRLRKEINLVLEKHHNQITYDSIQDMTYLSQVIDEALRMHPPGAQLGRNCVKDYKIPNHDLVIEEGTRVTISILGIHYDEEYYPEPHRFDPERFNEENKKSRHNFAHLPFGEGPRNCIGMRFGLLQSKVGLVSLIKSYKFTVNGRTQEPLSYQPSHVVLAAQGEIWLNVEKV